ncbi:LysE family translocator [uncultured Boseongicola sp.]|jgi:threonine/homoserine/homoserine lactone efflux protein|uniref:LysE family translocator n=1 Tax=uncultured Boseongicola sp. TaxID=1648499 RepID=UPI0026388E6B|nr:LysE family translocator [uncultured Boseongicola sp.]
MLTFALAVFFLIITPGPGVLSLAGVGAAFGFRHGSRYLLGLFFGTNLVCLGVITGLAAVMLAEPGVRTVFYVISVGYLVYLAFRIAFAGSKLAFIERTTPPGIKGGMLLQAVNPKAYAVNTALFSAFAFMPETPGLEVALKLLILNTIWTAIHFLWLWVGITLRRLDLPEKMQRAINIGMAASMLIVVALAAFAPH